MSTSVRTLDERSDAELISAVRAGDVAAYGELFARHVDAARRLSRQLVSPADVDDLVSEAFAKVLGILQRGGGPDLAFRAYLLTAVRRLHVDRLRATSRLHSTGDLTPFDPGVPFRDTAIESFESAAASRAFSSLPERWQLVLWHTEVEGHRPAEVAPLLGMTPNAVSALAYRAREGLRQAYLTMHAGDGVDDSCEQTRAELGAYVRGGLSRRDAARVEEHLQECRRCTALYLELTEVNADLRAVLAPLLLGTAAAAYLAPVGGATVSGVGLLLGRARDLVVSHASTAAVAGAAASAVIAGGLIAVHQEPGPVPGAADAPAVVTSTAAGPSDGPSPAPEPQRSRDVRRAHPTGPAERSGGLASAAAPAASGRAAAPTSRGQDGQPHAQPGAQPGAEPGAQPGAEPGAPAATPRPPAPIPLPEHPSGSPAPSDPPSDPAPAPVAPASPAAPGAVQVSAHVAVRPEGLEVGLGVAVAGVPVIPETTVGVPLPPGG